MRRLGHVVLAHALRGLDETAVVPVSRVHAAPTSYMPYFMVLRGILKGVVGAGLMFSALMSIFVYRECRTAMCSMALSKDDALMAKWKTGRRLCKKLAMAAAAPIVGGSAVAGTAAGGYMGGAHGAKMGAKTGLAAGVLLTPMMLSSCESLKCRLLVGKSMGRKRALPWLFQRKKECLHEALKVFSHGAWKTLITGLMATTYASHRFIPSTSAHVQNHSFLAELVWKSATFSASFVANVDHRGLLRRK